MPQRAMAPISLNHTFRSMLFSVYRVSAPLFSGDRLSSNVRFFTSVFSSVFGVPSHYASFSSGSWCVVSIVRLSQSSFIHLSFHYQIVYSTTTGIMSDNVLHQFIFHRQLGHAGVWLQCENRTHVNARFDMVIYHFIYNDRWAMKKLGGGECWSICFL